ncbi:MAG TPA: DUF4349 domain-containing protein [Rhizomicrobium sp.]
MVRKILLLSTCVLLLAGCGDRSKPMFMETRVGGLAADMVTPPSTNVSPAQEFSFTHAWTVLMAHGAVTARFTRTRDLCLHDKTLNCRLVSANISTDASEGFTSANLQVQLPHGKLEGFEHALLAPVAGERDAAAMASRSTQAQSVETQAGDTARKITQLTAYRDRLSDIAKRPSLSVDDMIKVEAERSRVQGELVEATNHHRDLTDGIARESVSIQLVERVESVGPIAQAFASAGATLADNTAAVLLFLVGAIPWLPIVAGGLYVMLWLWRSFRRRRALDKV